MKFSIVIPTYNERENIASLVEKIFSLDLNDTRIIIVDDNSPDGTGQIADSLAKKYPQKVEVIHRSRKMGIGSAYLEGFQKVLEDGADKVITMDADYSHHPKYLPLMIKEAKNHDIVVGSRYVEGGDFVIPSIFRKFLSWSANKTTRALLGVKVKDTTAGYKVYCKDFIEALDFENIAASGYAFQVEMIYKALKQGHTLKEIPIRFVYRNFGRSKVSAKEIIGSASCVLKLAIRHKNHKH